MANGHLDPWLLLRIPQVVGHSVDHLPGHLLTAVQLHNPLSVFPVFIQWRRNISWSCVCENFWRNLRFHHNFGMLLCEKSRIKSVIWLNVSHFSQKRYWWTCAKNFKICRTFIWLTLKNNSCSEIPQLKKRERRHFYRSTGNRSTC